MSAHRLLLAALVASAGGLAIGHSAREDIPLKLTAHAAVRLPDEGALPSFEGATVWLHSQPLTGEALRGKVVLVQVGTYTCVNWRRTLPYVRAWARKYGARGLVVVVVHTPEFDFERNVDNVRPALEKMGLDVPTAVDSDRAIWRAFRNEYWPALYVVDAKGRVRYHHFGEGDYERSERVIQQLLTEAGQADAGGPLVTVEGRGAEAPADWADVSSPETYLGYGRAERLVAPGGAPPNENHPYSAPARLRLNQWALEGDWTLREDAAAAGEHEGRIAYRFHAREST
jgi:thiol-disulfide isomerase/thioredoxin